MKILNMKLQNFMGIRDLELNLNGNDANIWGTNAAGKTTCFSAFMWLLFNKDSQNRSDFEIKTLKPDGKPERGLEHSVEAILELEDGSRLALKKVYQEKWTKKKGSATAEFTGHTTDHFVDGVPVQKKEYDARIAEIADENIFRLLTDPRYFNEVLHWQKRRELLLEVCGDVSAAEVIASKKDLAKLGDILGNRTIEQHRKVIQARKSEINKELEKIPVRIDEVKLNLPRIDDITNEKELPNDIAKLREELRAKQEELAQAKAGGQVAEKTKELRTIEGQMLDLRNKHRQSLDEKVAGKSDERVKLQNEINRLKVDIDAKNRTIQYNEPEIKSLDEKIETLRKDWHEENAKVFEQEQAAFLKLDTCPTCGQPLPQEQLQETRDKAMAQFNKAKAEKLEAISAEGKKLKDMKAAMEENLAYVRCELEKATAELAGLEKKEAALKEEINDIMQGEQPVESTPEYVRLQKQHEELQEQIRQAQADVSTTVAAIQKEADEISGAITALEQAKARFEARESGLKRIEDLKAEERKLATEYEELERQIYLTEEFIRAKVRLLEDRINSKFQMARFKLFDIQVNGALAECCETTYNGVPYSNLNNGARIQIGLDIIRTLQAHYGISCPVWVDNRESIVRLPEMDCQIISLIVSEKDKKLRIELAEKKEMKEDDVNVK
ncbi:MAG: AAA family ATPase [Clostridiaceae bacterium]|nr:AAA family ATPase [Clostridiaceae bacterium]